MAGRSGSSLARGANRHNKASNQTAPRGSTPGSQMKKRETSAIAEKIRREDFDRCAGSFANGQHALVKMLGAAIGEIIAGHGRDYNVSQSQSLRCLATRGVRIEHAEDDLCPGEPAQAVEKEDGERQGVGRIESNGALPSTLDWISSTSNRLKKMSRRLGR